MAHNIKTNKANKSLNPHTIHQKNPSISRHHSRKPPRSRDGAKQPPDPAARDKVDLGPSIQLTIQNIDNLASNFKDALIQSEPWSLTTEYQRQQLRHQYLSLIFDQSQAPDYNQPALVQQYAPDALNRLWIHTSHALINVYRQKLSKMDQEIEQSNLNLKKFGRRNQNPNSNQFQDSPPNVGPVARRKLVQRFRSFLSTEDAFWKSLINRLINEYRIDAARGCLKSLKIFSDYPVVEGTRPTNPSTDPSDQLETHQGLVRESLLPGISLVHKALICFGDLIRYGELYARNADPRDKLPELSAVQRDWSRSLECYDQARLLIPTNGNPSNQLAVLSSYIPDILSSTYHYYRALCVKIPFPSACQNLGITYSKALSKLLQANLLSQPVSDPPVLKPSDPVPNGENSVSHFKCQFVGLHAMLFTQASDSFMDLNVKLCDQFRNHLKDRLLSPELILKMIVTCMAAIWHARATRARELAQSRNADLAHPRQSAATYSYTTEVNATIHFLQFSSALLTVVKGELDSIDDSIHPVDLSQNISAVLRRILPAMRIISKWTLCNHFDYIDRMKQRLLRAKQFALNSQLETAEADFRTQYDQSILLATRHFPIDKLPSLDDSVKLEEDTELIGFLPIERAMKVRFKANSFNYSALSTSTEACHPNEEHLMRLGDLQRDASRITNTKQSPQKPNILSKASLTNTPHGPVAIENCDRSESAKINSSRRPEPVETEKPSDERINNPVIDEYNNWIDDDDPVELAMRAVVAQQMDREDNDTGISFPVDRDRHVKLEENQENINWDDNDEDDAEDEIVYLTTQSNSKVENHLEVIGLDHRSTIWHSTSSSNLKQIDQDQKKMSTAADLLASIISKPAPITNPTHHSQPRFDSSPIIPTAWTPFSFLDQTTSSSLRHTPIDAPAPRLGRRIPSISLPKPAEASTRINIWSTTTSNSQSPYETSATARMTSEWPTSTVFSGRYGCD